MNISVGGPKHWKLGMHLLFLSSRSPSPAPSLYPSISPRPRIIIRHRPRPRLTPFFCPIPRSSTTPRKSRSSNTFCFSYHVDRLALQGQETDSCLAEPFNQLNHTKCPTQDFDAVKAQFIDPELVCGQIQHLELGFVFLIIYVLSKI